MFIIFCLYYGKLYLHTDKISVNCLRSKPVTLIYVPGASIMASAVYTVLKLVPVAMCYQLLLFPIILSSKLYTAKSRSQSSANIPTCQLNYLYEKIICLLDVLFT